MKKLVLVICLALVVLGSANVWADTLCSNTASCTLTFTQGNSSSGFGTGNFGTLTLTLSGGAITVDIQLASGFYAIQTGFPGVVGLQNSNGGTLSITGFSYTGYTDAIIQGANGSQHWDGFGYSNTTLLTGPKAGSSDAVNHLVFTLHSTTPFTDVNQILNLFTPAGGDGAAYFVVDVINRNTSGPGAGMTGLITINEPGTPVPEPASLLLLGTGLVGLGGAIRRKLGK